MKSFTTYRHLRTHDGGDVTAACELIIDEENPANSKLRVGFAFCSPKENCFSKKRGRLIALGRLQQKPLTLKYTNGKNLADTLLDILDGVVEGEYRIKKAPQWLDDFTGDHRTQRHLFKKKFKPRKGKDAEDQATDGLQQPGEPIEGPVSG
jgi:hypothetical protein